jgi:hypothetical protein
LLLVVVTLVACDASALPARALHCSSAVERGLTSTLERIAHAPAVGQVTGKVRCFTPAE